MSVSLTHHQKEVDGMHKLSTILHFLIGICATVSGISLMIDSSGSIVGPSTTDLVNGPFTSFFWCQAPINRYFRPRELFRMVGWTS